MRTVSIRLAGVLLAVAALCLAVALARAQSPQYTIVSFGVSALSATASTGGSFAATGSVQQAAQQVMAGGAFTVTGGIDAPPPPSAPAAPLYLPYVQR